MMRATRASDAVEDLAPRDRGAARRSAARHGLSWTLAAVLAVPAGGCMALTPQLPPTDFAALETVSDRTEREALYEHNAIVSHDEPQGMRYTKGSDPSATKRSWQSLDAVLRSDATSAAALPVRRMRLSRLFTALTIASGILTIAGTAASAREGLNLQELNGTGGLLLGAGIATVAFGITAGVMYGKNRKQYARAVDLYNDSLGMRLGLNTASGAYIPPSGVLVDEEGFVVLDEREAGIVAPGPEAPPAADPQDPVDASPPDLAPTDPAPTDPAPADPAPADPAPTDPAPVEVPPVESAQPPPAVVPAPSPPPATVPPPPGTSTAGRLSMSLSLSPRG